MELRELVPGPDPFLGKQVVALADAINGRAQDFYVSNYLTLAAAVADMPGGGATLVINNPTNVTNDLTIPANVTLQFTHRGNVNITTGKVLTIVGPVEAGATKIFLNALSGQGTVSFASNKAIDLYKAAWWGVVGDNSTDCTAIVRWIIDSLFADNVEATIRLPGGRIIIAGALQDTSLSNAQIPLPKRTLAETQYNLTIEGAFDPSMLGLGVPTAGTVLVSTLSSGTGAMIGVKTSGTLGTSALNLTLRNLTLEMPANPTNSAVNLNYVMQPRGFNLRFTTGQTFAAWTQPSTTTSCALKMPLNNVPSTTYFENVVVDGFYIGVDVNELSRFKNLTIAGCERALNVHMCIHKAQIEKGLLINNRHAVYAPDNPATSFAWVDFELDIERATLTSYPSNPWFIGVDEINDAQNYLNGPIITHLDLPSGQIFTNETLIVVGGQYVQTSHYRSYTPTWTNVTIGNGTVTARYFKHRKQVTVELNFTLGSTSAVSGDIKFTLPVPIEPTTGGTGGVTPIGMADAFDGTDNWMGEVNAFSVTQGAVRFHVVSGTKIKYAAASATTPITWATGHQLNLRAIYQAEW
jgi:hypothetical protein